MPTRCAGTALLLLLGLGTAGLASAQQDTSNPAAKPPQPGKRTMQSQQEIAATLMRISDEDLQRTPLAALPTLGYRALSGQRFEGLALRAAARVDIGTQHVLPLLIAIGQGSDRARQMPLPRNAFFFVTRMDRGDGWAIQAFTEPEGKIPMAPGKLPPLPPLSQSVSVLGVEARDMQALGVLPREAGRYAVRMIAWDWVSNTVSVTLTGARKDSAPRAPAPTTQWLPTYRPMPARALGPTGPEESRLGLALTVTRDTSRADASLVARGSMHIKRDAEWPVSPVTGLSAIPAHLLFVRPNIAEPVVLSLLLEPSVKKTSKEAYVVEADFAVELDAPSLLGMPVSAYQAYLVVGDQISAAVPFEKTR
jgi:hypothetical protein